MQDIFCTYRRICINAVSFAYSIISSAINKPINNRLEATLLEFRSILCFLWQYSEDSSCEYYHGYVICFAEMSSIWAPLGISHTNLKCDKQIVDHLHWVIHLRVISIFKIWSLLSGFPVPVIERWKADMKLTWEIEWHGILCGFDVQLSLTLIQS